MRVIVVLVFVAQLLMELNGFAESRGLQHPILWKEIDPLIARVVCETADPPGIWDETTKTCNFPEIGVRIEEAQLDGSRLCWELGYVWDYSLNRCTPRLSEYDCLPEIAQDCSSMTNVLSETRPYDLLLRLRREGCNLYLVHIAFPADSLDPRGWVYCLAPEKAKKLCNRLGGSYEGGLCRLSGISFRDCNPAGILEMLCGDDQACRQDWEKVEFSTQPFIEWFCGNDQNCRNDWAGRQLGYPLYHPYRALLRTRWSSTRGGCEVGYADGHRFFVKIGEDLYDTLPSQPGQRVPICDVENPPYFTYHYPSWSLRSSYYRKSRPIDLRVSGQQEVEIGWHDYRRNAKIDLARAKAKLVFYRNGSTELWAYLCFDYWDTHAPEYIAQCSRPVDLLAPVESKEAVRLNNEPVYWIHGYAGKIRLSFGPPEVNQHIGDTWFSVVDEVRWRCRLDGSVYSTEQACRANCRRQ